MNEPVQITDEKSLKAWLKTRPHEDSITIAHRAAMRVLPVWLRAVARDSDLTALPVLRCDLISGVARKYPTPEIRAATATANVAATNVAARATATAFAAAARAAAAAFATATARAFATSFAADTARAAATAAARAAVWRAIEADRQMIEAGGDPLTAPLWPDENPLADLWPHHAPVLKTTPGGAFWIDWYQRALDGAPQPWPLLKDIALIEDDLWKKATKSDDGARALDAKIGGLVQKHALAASANAERIEPNPDTGRLHLVPDTQLPDDLGAYIRRKMLGAVGIFDDAPSQEYSGLAPDLQMLRRAVDDAGNMPVELFDACSSAIRRLEIRARTGDCPPPEKDPLIEDYRKRLREAGQDILAGDETAREVLQSRAAIEGNPALIEAKDEVNTLTDAAVTVSEGRLADTLPEDAAKATDPDADPEERAAASFRLSGRLLRVVVRVGIGFGIGIGAVTAGAGFVQAVEYLASPKVQQVLAAIYRYLGL